MIAWVVWSTQEFADFRFPRERFDPRLPWPSYLNGTLYGG